MLPRAFGRLHRRTLVSPQAIVASRPVIAIAIVVATGSSPATRVRSSRASSRFGVLLAFTAAQLAVIELRIAEPDLHRPFRARLNIRVRGVRSRCPRSSARR